MLLARLYIDSVDRKEVWMGSQPEHESFGGCSQFWSRWCCGRWSRLLFCLPWLMVRVWVSMVVGRFLMSVLFADLRPEACHAVCLPLYTFFKPFFLLLMLQKVEARNRQTYSSAQVPACFSMVLMTRHGYEQTFCWYCLFFFSPSLCLKGTWCLTAVQYGSRYIFQPIESTFNPLMTWISRQVASVSIAIKQVQQRFDQVSPNDGKLEVFTRQGPYGAP